MLAIPRILIAVACPYLLPDRWRTLFRARTIEYRALHPGLSNHHDTVARGILITMELKECRPEKQG